MIRRFVLWAIRMTENADARRYLGKRVTPDYERERREEYSIRYMRTLP